MFGSVIEMKKFENLISKKVNFISTKKSKSFMQQIITITIFLFFAIKIFGQTDSTNSVQTDVYVIDSYITPDAPHKLIVSFFTSDSCTSKIVLMKKYFFDVSKKLSDNHKIEIALEKIKSDSSFIEYEILVYDVNGNGIKTEPYQVQLPSDIKISSEQNAGLFRICLGGVIFSIPSPTYVMMKNENYWAITKEIPLFSFYSIGYNYPAGYLGAEYSHIFKADKNFFFRFGYKHIFQTSFIKYLSPGINWFTDFKGYGGMSIELSAGLFQIQNVFTFYTRYRYNFQLKSKASDFYEISCGLYSNFFSINLNSF